MNGTICDGAFFFDFKTELRIASPCCCSLNTCASFRFFSISNCSFCSFRCCFRKWSSGSYMSRLSDAACPASRSRSVDCAAFPAASAPFTTAPARLTYLFPTAIFLFRIAPVLPRIFRGPDFSFQFRVVHGFRFRPTCSCAVACCFSPPAATNFAQRLIIVGLFMVSIWSALTPAFVKLLTSLAFDIFVIFPAVLNVS